MARHDVDSLSGAALYQWFRRPLDEIEEERQRALAAGRELWNKGTRTGQCVSARTQTELEAIGRSELARQAGGAAARGGAVARAAANQMTGGRADKFSAAADALLGFGDGETVRDRYRSNLQQEHRRSRSDATRYPTLKPVGDVAGEVLKEALIYRLGARMGASASSRLPPKAKGALGEVLSAGKSTLRGDPPVALQQPLAVTGGKTIRDHVTWRGKSVEAKFGPTARLRPRQREAQRELGDRYRVDRWLPHHVGRISGAATAAGAVDYGHDD
jgi:hypothetical protein